MERNGEKSSEVKLTFRVYPQQKEKLYNKAKKKGVSANTFIRNIIDQLK